ncbi:helix-turn-helix domain-containing protein [Lacticaseibacillus sharpeae]|nr:helix-turn-helix domain-containing protein [Lacticaseibacillus sharpeae]
MTEDLSENDLGNFFHQQRIQRGITLAEALPGSASALSRFERGQSKLANQSMFAVMTNIGIRFEDLYNAIPVFSQKHTMLIDQLWRARYSDLESLKRMVQQANTVSEKQDYKTVVLNSFLNYLVSGEMQQLTALCESKVLNQLATSSSWTIDDYQLVMISALFMTNSGLKDITSYRGKHSANEFTGYRVYYLKAMTELLLSLLIHGAPRDLRIKVAAGLQKESVTVNGDEDILLVNSLAALAQLECKQLGEQSVLQDTIKPYMRAARAINFDGYVSYLERLCLRLTGTEMTVIF